MRKVLLLVLVSALGLTGCGPVIYKSQAFDEALLQHKIVAILPADVNIKLRSNVAKKYTLDQLLDMQQKTGYDIQDKMYHWFLKGSAKYNYTVSFQNVSRTNTLLKQAGVDLNNLGAKDLAALAKLLGVDAVIRGQMRMDKPVSEAVSVAVAFLGVFESTNRIFTTININDGKSGNLLWKYDYETSGSFESSKDDVVDQLMRNASKKFPYKAS